MAGVLFRINSGEVTIPSATTKTILQLKSPTNQCVLAREFIAFCKSLAQAADTGLRARWTRNTGSFGTGSSFTPIKDDVGDTETIQSTAANNFTVEPTSPTDTGDWFQLYPMNEIINYLPPDKPMKCRGGYSLQLEVNNPNAGSYVVGCTMLCEE